MSPLPPYRSVCNIAIYPFPLDYESDEEMDMEEGIDINDDEYANLQIDEEIEINVVDDYGIANMRYDE